MNDPRVRSDISKFLVNLTKNTQGKTAEENLISILNMKTIEARNHHCLFSPKIKKMSLTPTLLNSFKTVCFTETPLNQINKLTVDGFNRKIKLKPFGLVFWRHKMIEKGANPAIYLNGDGTALREYLLSEFNNHFAGIKSLQKLKNQEQHYKEITHYYSLINLMASRHDFSWEREWRHSGSFKFLYRHVVAIIADDPENFITKCKKIISRSQINYINRIPIISADWSYEDVVEEMAIKIWEQKV